VDVVAGFQAIEVPQCKWCHKLYARRREPFCPSCLQRQEEDLLLVEDFLREDSRASFAQISRATGVSHRTLMEFLRSGRLVRALVELAMETNCPKCGTRIQIGRGCPTCITAELRARAEGRRSASAPPPPNGRPTPAPRLAGRRDRKRKSKSAIRGVFLTHAMRT